MMLSDNQVNSEMQKLINFIKVEAMEKAREIHIKSNEEFSVEKAKIVHQEMIKIDEFYKQKMKKTAINQQISKSNIINSARLKLLEEREKVLSEVFKDVVEILSSLSQNETRYQELLRVLILQGLYQLMEENVIIRGRQSDSTIIEKAINDAVEIFRDETHININVMIDNEYLSSNGLGGVIIFEANKNVSINNTFEERLNLLKIDALPIIRLILFGKSENRKFYD
ncbi:hypothetical protein PCK1_000515 [Pneumocystis canis]|nr:hypothetical protein PCK1_000515 [Pneumocystis canis]